MKGDAAMTPTLHKGLFPAFFSMELFWLFAWADFFMKSTAGLSVPFFSFMAAYFFSFALASGFREKNLRLIWVILGHGLVLCGVAAFAAGSATGMILPSGSGVFQWYQSGLAMALTGLFWYKGTKLAFRKMSYKMVCNYFDLGVSLFFGLLLVKLLIFYRSGVRLGDAFLLYLMAGFFFSGLAAIFFSSASTTHKKQYVEGFRGIGVLISFCMLFLLCGMGLVFVLMPLMTSLAESGYTVLKGVSGSFSPYLISILRFILTVPKPRAEGTAAPPDQGIQGFHAIGMTGEAGWFFDLVFYGILFLMAAVAVVLLGALVLRVFRFLMQRPVPVAENHPILWSGLWRFLNTVLNFFRKRILLFFSKIETAQTGFSKLMAWGRKSGVQRRFTETPGEYAKRLQNLFSPLEKEIFTIVQAFHRETYGEMKLTGPELDKMIAATKKIHSPAFWLIRLRTGIKRV